MNETRVAVETAIHAGEILKAYWNRTDLQVYEKDLTINPVTEVDRKSEELIKSDLRRAFPQHGILTEEGTETFGGSNARWIVDPLDGTTNYIAGYPSVAVSIALELDKRLVLGVVYNPITDELFVGEDGQGAALNGHPIRVSKVFDLGSSLIASGFPYDAWENEDNNTREWARFVSLTRSLRCDGSTSLDLCRVACGQFDGFWEKGVYPWDIAAGIVIGREAGGLVTDWHGSDECLVLGQVVAANRMLHEKMLAALEEFRRGRSVK